MTSGKAFVAHGEVVAGALGILKCVLMGLYAVGSPNVHLNVLNPNIDPTGVPVLFTTEMVDQGKNEGFFGVSSFGFAGSNARGDVWCIAQHGNRMIREGDFGRTMTNNGSANTNKFDSMASSLGFSIGLEGVYGIGNLDTTMSYFLKGSWDAWSGLTQMISTKIDSSDVYEGECILGDTLTESFQIFEGGYEDACIFPERRCARQDAVVFGPGKAPPGYRWIIDGHKDHVLPGACYAVRLWWDAEAQEKRVSWTLKRQLEKEELKHKAFEHEYSICGSWTAWACVPMVPMQYYENKFRTNVTIGITGEETFHFERNGDPMEAIYPARDKTRLTSTPIRGPDDLGEGKNWQVCGETGEVISIILEICEGKIKVTMMSATRGKRVWSSPENPSFRDYYVIGSLTDGECVPMYSDDACPGIFRAQVTKRHEHFNQFHVVVDEDSSQALYPEMQVHCCGACPIIGPDRYCEGHEWVVDEEVGSLVEIVLDFTKQDKRQVLMWKVISNILCLEDMDALERPIELRGV